MSKNLAIHMRLTGLSDGWCQLQHLFRMDKAEENILVPSYYIIQFGFSNLIWLLTTHISRASFVTAGYEWGPFIGSRGKEELYKQSWLALTGNLQLLSLQFYFQKNLALSPQNKLFASCCGCKDCSHGQLLTKPTKKLSNNHLFWSVVQFSNWSR